jgi:hypothetical protein
MAIVQKAYEYFKAGLKTLGNLIVDGTSTLTGAVTMASTLAVTGAATLASTLAVTGISTLAAALNSTVGAATAAVGLRFGASATEGLEFKVIEESVEADGSAAYDLTQDIPAGAVILSVQANLDTIVAATTAVKVGIGVTDNEDKYGKTSALTKNLKIDTVPDWAVLASAEDVQVFACDTAGDDAGTLDTGTIRVRIVYVACNSLDDAA